MLSAEHGDILILPYAGGWYDQPPDCISELKVVQNAYKEFLKEENERIMKKNKKDSVDVGTGSTFGDARRARLSEE